MSQTLLLLNLAVGVVLPALVGFVTNREAPGQVKSLLLLALSAVGAVLTTAIQQNHFHFGTFVVSFATTFLTAVGAHFGLLKPAGVTGQAGVVSGVGLSLGGSAPAPVPAGTTPVQPVGPAAPGEGDAAP